MLRILSFTFGILFGQIAFAYPQVLLETSHGNLVVELYDTDMPVTVKNFLSYVESGFYNGTIFHRVIQDSLIQGGGYNRDLSKKERQAPIQNESKENLKHLRGTIAMARLSSPHTATSEFFINLNTNTQFDYKDYNIGYAVFGRVTDETMSTLDSINYVAVGTEGMYKYVPNQAVEIIKATRIADSASSGPVLPPKAPATSTEAPASE